MPFNADTRAGILDIKFNVSVIHEELEAIYEKTYTGDTDEGSLFWEYVCDLESSFTNSLRPNLLLTSINFKSILVSNIKSTPNNS